MIRFIGAAMILMSSVLWGMMQAKDLRSRAYALRKLQWSLEIMAKEISTSLKPINEIMMEFKNEPAPVGEFYGKVESELRNGKSFEKAWRSSINDGKTLQLKENEAEAMSELGSVLGRYGASEQATSINSVAFHMGKFANEAEKECSERSKLVIAAGACAGIAAIVLLI